MKRLGISLVICTVLQFIQCFPATDHFITISNNDPFKHAMPETILINNDPELYSMRVNTDVHYRYATTVVSSRVANPANYSQEVEFSIVIPETAFISAFLMEIDGKVYKAYVKEKKDAKQEYHAAVQSGIGAAHVAVSARDSNRFTVNVNVEALSKATFNLTYEELLTRRLDVYNLVINLHLNQIIRDLSVDVNILENSKINVLRTPVLRSGNEVDADENTKNNPFAKIEFDNDQKTKAHISFSPTIDQQKQLIKMNKMKNMENVNKDGLYGQFVVQYDVERDSQGGEIMIYDGYFVHFFAPNELKPLNKYVIFVLDVSGSMHGRKIEQLREAMLAILTELKEGDYFDIIEFSDRGKVFKIADPMETVDYNYYIPKIKSEKVSTEPYAATKYNINKANSFIKNLNIDYYGGTNIYDALNTVLNVSKSGMNTLLAKKTSNSTLPEPLIIFLTDGEPTVGETNIKKIISMVSEFNFGDKKTAIFSLAFGEDPDRRFLKELALRNSGFMKHIYEAADASLQLQHFYKQISSLLLTDVKFKYPANQIDEASVTEHVFPNLFSGTELVVAGKINKQDIHPLVSGYSIRGPTDFTPKVIPFPSSEKEKPSLERLWAYLTIKQLLDKKDLDPVVLKTNEKNKETHETKALRLALKYSFVTPLTSLIVVKPNATSAVDAETAKERPQVFGTSGTIPSSVGSSYGPVTLQSSASMPSSAGFAYGQQYVSGTSQSYTGMASSAGGSYGQHGPIGPISSRSPANMPTSIGSSYGQQFSRGYSQSSANMPSFGGGSYAQQYIPGASQSSAFMPSSPGSSYGLQYSPIGPVSSQSPPNISPPAGKSFGQQYVSGASQNSAPMSFSPGSSYGLQYGPFGPISSQSPAIMPPSAESSYGQQYVPGNSQSSASMPSSPDSSYGQQYGPIGPISSHSPAIMPPSVGSSYGQFSPGYYPSSTSVPSSGGGYYGQQQFIPGVSQSSAFMTSWPGSSYGLQYGPYGPVSSQSSTIFPSSPGSSYGQHYISGASQSSASMPSYSYGLQYGPFGPVSYQSYASMPTSIGGYYGQQYGSFSSHNPAIIPPTAGSSYGQYAPVPHRFSATSPTAGSIYGGFDGTLQANFIVTPRLQDQFTSHQSQHNKISPPIIETSRRVDLSTFDLGQLTWLQDYTIEPDWIQIPNGIYKIGVLKNITDFSACKLPENKNGTCVFLPSCSKVFSQLENLDSYMPMFCHILDYAGICCPDEN